MITTRDSLDRGDHPTHVLGFAASLLFDRERFNPIEFGAYYIGKIQVACDKSTVEMVSWTAAMANHCRGSIRDFLEPSGDGVYMLERIHYFQI